SRRVGLGAAGDGLAERAAAGVVGVGDEVGREQRASFDGLHHRSSYGNTAGTVAARHERSPSSVATRAASPRKNVKVFVAGNTGEAELHAFRAMALHRRQPIAGRTCNAFP